MDNEEIDGIIRRALENERELPAGLTERLEARIEHYAANHKIQRPMRQRKKLYMLITTVAASLLIGIAALRYTASYKPVDTFSDPYEAAVVAQSALELMSAQLNRGIAPVVEAKHIAQKANETLSKKLEILQRNQQEQKQ